MNYDKSLLGILDQAYKGQTFHETQMDQVLHFTKLGYLSPVNESERRYILTEKGNTGLDDLKTLCEILGKHLIIDFDGLYG